MAGHFHPKHWLYAIPQPLGSVRVYRHWAEKHWLREYVILPGESEPVAVTLAVYQTHAATLAVRQTATATLAVQRTKEMTIER